MPAHPVHTWREFGSDLTAAQIDTADAVLDGYDRDLRLLGAAPTDGDIMVAAERAVTALNDINSMPNAGHITTIEREDLCDYIAQALTDSGIDVRALEDRLGIDEITEGRDW